MQKIGITATVCNARSQLVDFLASLPRHDRKTSCRGPRCLRGMQPPPDVGVSDGSRFPEESALVCPNGQISNRLLDVLADWNGALGSSYYECEP